MTPTMKVILAVFFCIAGRSIGSAQAVGSAAPCPKMVTTLGRSLAEIERKANVVEIRSCDPGLLQLVAWGEKQQKPLIIDTNRTSIVSLATAIDRVYVIETAGASSNIVQIIVFENGVARLALDDAYKAYPEIKVTADRVTVTISMPGERPKVLTFPTGIE